MSDQQENSVQLNKYHSIFTWDIEMGVHSLELITEMFRSNGKSYTSQAMIA